MITAARRKNAGLFFCQDDLDCDGGVLLDEVFDNSSLPAFHPHVKALHSVAYCEPVEANGLLINARLKIPEFIFANHAQHSNI